VGGIAPPSLRVRGACFFSDWLKLVCEIYQRSGKIAAQTFAPCSRRNWRREFRAPLLVAVLSLAGVSLSAREVRDQTGRRVNVPEHPVRLVSLAPSITETLYALGLGDHVVGDTDYCEYPAEAKLKPHVGPILNPSLEKIVELKPDLVLGSPEANRIETADRLARLGIPLYGVTARSVEETLHSVEDLGWLLNREAAARSLLEGLRRRIVAVEEGVAGRGQPKVLFVVWYRPLTTAGAHTFITDVIHRAGGVSISEDLPGEWPRLSLEEALRRDPDVILLPRAESFSPELEELRHLPGWRDLRAVKNRRMYFISDTIIRPSPRLVDALEEVARVLHPPDAAPQKDKP
jgi:iron complex transport system substrate-binding protein